MTKPSVYELADKWDRVLVRLSNGRLAGLKNFTHYGDIKYIGVVEKEQWHQDWELDDENYAHTIDLWNAYERNSYSHRFDIDAIAFLSNSSEVTDALEFGCDEDIDWDWDINNPQCDDQMDTYEYCVSSRSMGKSQIFRKTFFEGVDNNNMMNGILSVYEEKQLRKINKKYDDLEQSIKLSDERYKTWLECTTTLDKLYAEDKIVSFEHANIELSKDTKIKLRTFVYDKREEELRKLSEKIREVQSQLIMCDTYDQKQEILRRYNIINKNGKVNG